MGVHNTISKLCRRINKIFNRCRTAAKTDKALRQKGHKRMTSSSLENDASGDESESSIPTFDAPASDSSISAENAQLSSRSSHSMQSMMTGSENSSEGPVTSLSRQDLQSTSGHYKTAKTQTDPNLRLSNQRNICNRCRYHAARRHFAAQNADDVSNDSSESWTTTLNDSAETLSSASSDDNGDDDGDHSSEMNESECCNNHVSEKRNCLNVNHNSHSTNTNNVTDDVDKANADGRDADSSKCKSSRTLSGLHDSDTFFDLNLLSDRSSDWPNNLEKDITEKSANNVPSKKVTKLGYKICKVRPTNNVKIRQSLFNKSWVETQRSLNLKSHATWKPSAKLPKSSTGKLVHIPN